MSSRDLSSNDLSRQSCAPSVSRHKSALLLRYRSSPGNVAVRPHPLGTGTRISPRFCLCDRPNRRWLFVDRVRSGSDPFRRTAFQRNTRRFRGDYIWQCAGSRGRHRRQPVAAPSGYDVAALQERKIRESAIEKPASFRHYSQRPEQQRRIAGGEDPIRRLHLPGQRTGVSCPRPRRAALACYRRSADEQRRRLDRDPRLRSLQTVGRRHNSRDAWSARSENQLPSAGRRPKRLGGYR